MDTQISANAHFMPPYVTDRSGLFNSPAEPQIGAVSEILDETQQPTEPKHESEHNDFDI